ncbi:MAG: hypothetical protein JWL69_5148 [Phycisphaerales bacterium]|nr:hypothetical protein [Phycisphaerales bacterium]
MPFATWQPRVVPAWGWVLSWPAGMARSIIFHLSNLLEKVPLNRSKSVKIGQNGWQNRCRGLEMRVEFAHGGGIGHRHRSGGSRGGAVRTGNENGTGMGPCRLNFMECYRSEDRLGWIVETAHHFAPHAHRGGGVVRAARRRGCTAGG